MHIPRFTAFSLSLAIIINIRLATSRAVVIPRDTSSISLERSSSESSAFISPPPTVNFAHAEASANFEPSILARGDSTYGGTDRLLAEPDTNTQANTLLESFLLPRDGAAPSTERAPTIASRFWNGNADYAVRRPVITHTLTPRFWNGNADYSVRRPQITGPPARRDAYAGLDTELDADADFERDNTRALDGIDATLSTDASGDQD